MKARSPFQTRLEAMVHSLCSHPKVEVYEYLIRPPATQEAIAQAEQAVGSPLPQALREFYLAHDGVFLEWGLRSQTYEEKTTPFHFPDYGQPPGCINLLPVRDAISPSWEKDYHVNEIDTNHQALLFGSVPEPQPPVLAVCLDNYSKYNHGDLIFGPEPAMVVSTDHGADMDSSDFTSFEVYLDMTLSLYGLCRYEYGVGIGWSRRSQRLLEWTQRPSLDELIERLEAKS